MVCLGFEPRAAGWQAQTKPWSYGGQWLNVMADKCSYRFKLNSFFLLSTGQRRKLRKAKLSSLEAHFLRKETQRNKETKIATQTIVTNAKAQIAATQLTQKQSFFLTSIAILNNEINHSNWQRFRCCVLTISVTRLGDVWDFGQLFKAFGNN